MDNPVRKMVQLHPELLAVLKTLSKDTGLELDQLINLALYEMGLRLGHIKTSARDMRPLAGFNLFDEAEPEAPPTAKPKPNRKPPRTTPPPKPARPKRPSAKVHKDILYLQVDDGPLTQVRKSVFLIGRGSKCDHIIHHRSVSREHAVITSERNGWFIEDLNSANGTWLDGHQISKHRLGGGEEIAISNHVLRMNIRAG
jgi:hypothetical protein